MTDRRGRLLLVTLEAARVWMTCSCGAVLVRALAFG